MNVGPPGNGSGREGSNHLPSRPVIGENKPNKNYRRITKPRNVSRALRRLRLEIAGLTCVKVLLAPIFWSVIQRLGRSETEASRLTCDLGWHSVTTDEARKRGAA